MVGTNSRVQTPEMPHGNDQSAWINQWCPNEPSGLIVYAIITLAENMKYIHCHISLL